MSTLHFSLRDILLEQVGTSVELPITIDIEQLLEQAIDDEYHVDLDDYLANDHKVGFIWDIVDVKLQRPDLDDDQCWQVLKQCRGAHDCNIGMNWEVIDTAAELLYGSAPDSASEAEA